MIKEGTRVRIKDLLTLLSLSENDGRPFVNSEMKWMAGKIFYIQSKKFYWIDSKPTDWYSIEGWKWSRDMFDVLEKDPPLEYFLELFNKKFKNENKISLYDLEELYE